MTALRASSIAELLNASSDDKKVLAFDVPDAAFGYHAQQTVEKLYKALITANGQVHPFIHDLVALRKSLENLGETLPAFCVELEKLTSFAGQFRYAEPIHLDDPQRDQVRVWVEGLQSFCLTRIGELGMLPTMTGTRWH